MTDRAACHRSAPTARARGSAQRHRQPADLIALTFSTDSCAANAAFVGANTVNGAVTASTRMLNSSVDAIAVSTIFLFGGSSTLSIAWITPLLAAMSAATMFDVRLARR